jgi:hypothetical protein
LWNDDLLADEILLKQTAAFIPAQPGKGFVSLAVFIPGAGFVTRIF